MSKRIRASDELKFQKKEVSRLGSIVRKRIERMEKAELVSEKAQNLIKELELSKGRYGASGRGDTEIKRMYSRYVDFLTSENSTLTEYKNTLKKLNEHLQLTTSKNVKEIQTAIQNFNQTVFKTQSIIKTNLGTYFDYYKVVQKAREYVEGKQLDLSQIDSVSDSFIKNLLEVQNVDKGYEGYRIGMGYEWIDD